MADNERKLLLDDAFFCFYVLITICDAFEKVLMVPVGAKNELQHLDDSSQLAHHLYKQSHFQGVGEKYVTRYQRRMNQPSYLCHSQIHKDDHFYRHYFEP
jgi:hypothetical protein